ncbi:LysR family transcriptional regulator [Pseudomonas kairouanensis]|uniref:LysR family transcriptional regulator n=1 Tax=Pseudomonas kairouanensis TaxID=2293832 RepID=A0A4Z0AN91_9PSED|nr:LysR family transcriptional regulator [Pseudomonas kairouanensis]TFY87408.1 LysR family transcriptional regulator [Pseudomonas kairouanensis]
MEFKHLRSFVTLAEDLHFGRAARRLSIVQPALSMQIKMLEHELGVRLFDRNRHSVTLTEVGAMFLPEARATLKQSAYAVDVAKASSRGEIGRVRLGFVSSVLPELLPKLVRALHERFPRIQLELKDMPGPEQAAALKDGRLDFGLMRLPTVIAGIHTREVLQETLTVALPRNHPLAMRDSLTPEVLAQEPVFILARQYAPGFFDGLMQALDSHGGRPLIASELGEFTTMLALVSAGLGIGLLPTNAARALPADVVSKPLALGGYRATTGLAWVDLNSPVKTTVFDLMNELLGVD